MIDLFENCIDCPWLKDGRCEKTGGELRWHGDTVENVYRCPIPKKLRLDKELRKWEWRIGFVIVHYATLLLSVGLVCYHVNWRAVLGLWALSTVGYALTYWAATFIARWRLWRHVREAPLKEHKDQGDETTCRN